eukprot:CAMPEP_0197443820 /NCGR_PEP_ID=MMETSP1175-20131217/9455_1 /TAXON_ID=1003142 /ORGANISM="Triceratium dubium, Strain CCMP147" /LENGTH=504 /DNA_ID=CAMNT_0042974503 /DNA_START=123 /DNA_END=1637 /DNA_ORIENTATION=+
MTFKSLALAALVSGAGASERELSFPRIGLGFEPGTNVIDRAVIDLDQLSFETLLGLQTTEGFEMAGRVYREGGNAKSYADIAVEGGLATAVGQGAMVQGVNEAGETVTGMVYADTDAGKTDVRIQYKISDTVANHVGCKVGGLPDGEQVMSGCLANEGTITIGGTSYTYSYNPTTDNNNGRTLQGFSLQAKKKMYDCGNGCPYKEHNDFFLYYGVHDYGDKWVSSALSGSSTSFDNFNANFATYGYEGRAEIAKKGSAYINVLMYVIREFRDAVDDCKLGKTKDNDDAVVAWDEGVAFYAGSLEGTDGSGSGKLIFGLADKRCQDYRTCGRDGNELTGISKINYQMFELFTTGQGQIANGQCDALETTTNRIAQLMFVPVIQGSIRYAHKVDKLGNGEKAKAEGAIFTAAVLPLVAACSPEAAQTIASNMQVGADNTNFAEVVQAYESQYSCLGISKSDIGMLWDHANSAYYPDASTLSSASTLSMIGASLGAIASAVLTFAIM